MNDCIICDEFTKKHFNVIAGNLNFFSLPYIIFINLLALVSFIAILGNGFIIATILKTPHLQSPSYLLITSMAAIDLALALVFYPFLIARTAWRLQEDLVTICTTGKTYRAVGLCLVLMSLMMSLLISIDRYLAISLRNRYRSTVTKKRAIWASLLALSMMAFLSVIVSFGVSFLYWNLLAGVLGLLIFLFICAFYFKSFIALRRYVSLIDNQQNNTSQSSFDATKYKKSLNTMVIILVWLLVCFVPLLSMQYVLVKVGLTKVAIVTENFSAVIFGVNSCTNPIIYIWRFTDVRNACRETARKITGR